MFASPCALPREFAPLSRCTNDVSLCRPVASRFAFYIQNHERTTHAPTHRNTCSPKAVMDDMVQLLPEYEYRLTPMSSARSRAGAPGEMIEPCRIPADDKEYDTLFLFLNGVASFVDFKQEDKTLMPPGAQGWFCKLSSDFATLFER